MLLRLTLEWLPENLSLKAAFQLNQSNYAKIKQTKLSPFSIFE